jgi:predicted RNase H-like nuclease
MATTIIGIDCAVEARNIGLAKALLNDSGLSVVRVGCGGRDSDLLDLLTRWIGESERVLLALDAPLGWPDRLGSALANHVAGAPVDGESNRLFRRYTDDVVAERCRKRPLDVGADRIARTAMSALGLLGALARTLGAIPLAWTSSFPGKLAAIEVYPAATLIGRGIRSQGYKRPGDADARRTIVERLSDHVDLQVDRSDLVDDADRLDAVVCAVAGADFLRGETVAPDDEALARREGWIWFRAPAG